eukprot:gene11237-12417_t
MEREFRKASFICDDSDDSSFFFDEGDKCFTDQEDVCLVSANNKKQRSSTADFIVPRSDKIMGMNEELLKEEEIEKYNEVEDCDAGDEDCIFVMKQKKKKRSSVIRSLRKGTRNFGLSLYGFLKFRGFLKRLQKSRKYRASRENLM